MNIETLSLDELKKIYDTKMQEDFPPSELRPFSSMEYLIQQGAYHCFAYRDSSELLGYALFASSKNAALLDYYAVSSTRRGQGIGSSFLKGLREHSEQFGTPYILIEVESVESAQTPDQIEERERRIRFYKHCGCVETGVYSNLFGVEYLILILPLDDMPHADDEIKAALEELYRLIVAPVVENNEAIYNAVCRCYFGAAQKEPARDFARELGRAVTFLHRSRKSFMGERLREFGLSGAMYMILMQVGFHPGTTQDNIALHMYIDKSNVARRIKQLEELGYIYRETDLSDRRQNNLYLTDRGSGLLPLIKQYLSEWGQSISSELSDDELDTLLSLLGKMMKK